MSDVDHYAEAIRLARQAEGWRDFDRWPMDASERQAMARIDAQLATVHASLHSAGIHAEMLRLERAAADPADHKVGT